MIAWRFAPFAELSALEVHDILQARSAVFVVEQDCVFQDVDGMDPQSWHLLGHPPRAGEGGNGPLLAYCRLVPPGTKYPEASIGRVLTTGAGRRQGLGRDLMAEALRHAQALWSGQPLRIGAQMHLERFYGEFGFARASEPYDEDGIMHIEMVRNQGRANG